MKHAVPYLLLVFLAIGFLAVLDDSCASRREIREWKLKYEGYRAIVEADHAMSLERITSLERASAEYLAKIQAHNAEILARDATIATLRGKVTDANAATEALRTEVQPVLDANPKVAELVASLDAGIILRDALIVEQQSLIVTLKDRVALGDERLANQVAISDEWKAMYDREHALRLNCEKGLALYEKRYRQSRVWTAVGKYGLPVAAVLGYALAK